MVDDKSDKARSLFKDKMTRMAKSHLQGAVEGILSDGAFWEDAELVLHDELEQSIAHLTFDPASGLQVGIRAGSDQSEAYVFIPLEWDIYRAEREENQDDYFPEVDIMDGADNSAKNFATPTYSAGFLPASTHRLAPPITVFCGAPGTSG